MCNSKQNKKQNKLIGTKYRLVVPRGGVWEGGNLIRVHQIFKDNLPYVLYVWGQWHSSLTAHTAQVYLSITQILLSLFVQVGIKMCYWLAGLQQLCGLLWRTALSDSSLLSMATWSAIKSLLYAYNFSYLLPMPMRREMGESGRKEQTSSYKVSMSWGCNIHIAWWL